MTNRKWIEAYWSCVYEAEGRWLDAWMEPEIKPLHLKYGIVIVRCDEITSPVLVPHCFALLLNEHGAPISVAPVGPKPAFISPRELQYMVYLMFIAQGGIPDQYHKVQ